MKTIKELEADLKLAEAIHNQEWITQLNAKLEHTKDVLELIDEMRKEGKLCLNGEELKQRLMG